LSTIGFCRETNTSTYPRQENNKNGEVRHSREHDQHDTARRLFAFRQFHTEGFVTLRAGPDAGDGYSR
jgi:hypothetical protein